MFKIRSNKMTPVLAVTACMALAAWPAQAHLPPTFSWLTGDLDGDGIRDDSCMMWECQITAEESYCEALATIFGDIGGASGSCGVDGVVDGNDYFHVLDCFSNIDTAGARPYPCESAAPRAESVDVGGPFGDCSPDGACDLHDLVHIRRTLRGTSSCDCVSVITPPRAVGIPPAQRVAVRAVADRSRVEPGEQIEVHVLLDAVTTDVQGYQVGLRIAGGHRGSLDVVDIFIADRRDHVLAGASIDDAYNIDTAQMLALSEAGARKAVGSYLVTFVLQASEDALGPFTVAVDDQKTVFMFAEPDGLVDLEARAAARIEVGSRGQPLRARKQR